MDGCVDIYVYWNELGSTLHIDLVEFSCYCGGGRGRIGEEGRMWRWGWVGRGKRKDGEVGVGREGEEEGWGGGGG